MNPSRIKLNGILGSALRRSAECRLKKVDYQQLADVFRTHIDGDGAWRCEFWGKVTRSAILTNYYLQDPELAICIENSVRAIMSTQYPDGSISSYPKEKHLSGWDIWGRKYVLRGLAATTNMFHPMRLSANAVAALSIIL